ncbi:MAG: ABC transporter substrate-binding protein, partial [Pyrinomonadaceae bacterium]
MSDFGGRRLRLAALLVSLSVLASACMSGAASDSEFFGKTVPPEGQVMRYISGSEPESLDPQVGTGQPEARLYMALYEGLAEYHPQTMEPIPAVAERWDVNNDSSEFVFHLRRNARFSNGDPITAHDFVYTFRRGVSPELAARNGYLAYYVKYAQAYNEGAVFVRDPATGEFLLDKDFKAAPARAEPEPLPPSATPTLTSPSSPELPATGGNPSLDTPFHRFMHSPDRL